MSLQRIPDHEIREVGVPYKMPETWQPPWGIAEKQMHQPVAKETARLLVQKKQGSQKPTGEPQKQLQAS